VNTDDSLHDHLETLYRTFDLSMLAPDPLETVRALETPQDREIGSFIASALAYGRAEKIVETVRNLFQRMDNAPYRFVCEFDPGRDAERFRTFVYRFSRGEDMVCLIMLVQRALREYGSLERLFLRVYRHDQPHVGPALTDFVETLLSYPCSLYRNHHVPTEAGVRYFLPSPRSGSACKRLNLFLRWMVRQDAIDLGLWRAVSPGRLIIPVDTHIARLSRALGLTPRRQADWRMALEITGALRVFDPDDPVKYDLSLCHLGMRQARGQK
jgi:uncharacterized protein (TIGR02757 family)